MSIDKNKDKSVEKAKTKIIISKPIDPTRLKGTKLEDYKSQMKIAADTANFFSKVKKDKNNLSNCWVCGIRDYGDSFNVAGIEFVQCSNCHHYYQKYILSEDVVYKFFEVDEKINCHLPQEQFDYRSKFVSKPKIDAFMQLRKELGLNNSKGNWLDAGCGAGELLYQVKKDYGWEVVGYDISKFGVEMAEKNGVKAFQLDIFQFYKEIFQKGKVKPFDIFSAIGYFDMVANPLEHLLLVKKMIKKGGFIMIDQPKFNSMSGDLIRALPDYAFRYANALERSIFTDQSLRYFLEKNGFEVMLDWRYGLDFYTFMGMISVKIPELAGTPVMKFLLEHFNEFQEIIDKHDYRDSLFYIARLKE
jgi:cyclopropane fatty-acyl-phospholipid synthase-like methyltransferase